MAIWMDGWGLTLILDRMVNEPHFCPLYGLNFHITATVAVFSLLWVFISFVSSNTGTIILQVVVHFSDDACM